MRRRAGVLLGLWRAEGTAGVAERARDHVAAARRRRRFRRVALGTLPRVPVLRLAAAPPVPWLGGVPAQLGTLMEAQARHRDTALLYPWRGGQRLEVEAEGERLAVWLPGELPADGAAPGESWAAAVRTATAALHAGLLHVEGAAGLPHATLAELAHELPLVLSLHDFALFCPRPNLYDESAGAPCGACADAATCEARLAAAGRADAALARHWREHGAELLAACRCAVYPSDYLRRAHASLFGSAGVQSLVIAPGIAHPRLLPWRWPWAERSARPRVAFLGGGAAHKGGRLLAEVLAEWSRRGLPAMRWEVLGGGGAEELAAIRRHDGQGGSRVAVHGYYRHGSLGRLLRAERIELAVLLPQVPESFSLSLSECLAAGVPVLALAQGALADRLAEGGGHLLPASSDAAAVVEALGRWNEGQLPAVEPPPPMPTGEAAAIAYARLFDDLLRETGAAVGPSAAFRFAALPGDHVRESIAGAERLAGAAARWIRGGASAGDLRSAWRARKGGQGPPAVPLPAPSAPPIVYLPALPWSFRFQRPQQLARAFVGAGHAVLYADVFQRTRALPRRSLSTTEAGVSVLHLAVPGRPDPYREALPDEVAEQLALTIAEGVRDKPLMILAQLPFWMPLAVRLRQLLGAPLVYDRIDFHLGFPGVPPDVDRLETELMTAADLVLASSPVLLEGCAGVPRRALVPNAVSLGDFPPVRRRFGEPVTVAYVGALGPWFDAAAVAALAAARPGWRVQLAGRVEAAPVRALARHENVELLGEIPYLEVPRFLAEVQALIIPFLDLPLTRAVDPVKLYEGLAAGLPVVSCALPAMAAWDEPYVYTYASEGLLPTLDRALAEDSEELAARRRAAVSDETWEMRAAEVLRLIREQPMGSIRERTLAE